MRSRERIRRSMLWATYGDALGFISELADSDGLRRRVGSRTVTQLMPWTRRLGGRFGVDVKLPAGCYSDDTQLRLATSRAINGEGTFDVDAFAKVELPVWLGYALGAGRGTRAAAEALSKPTVSWCTNFYSIKDVSYAQSGGNGAAMRVQPHVWAADDSVQEAVVLRDVIRNAITTHGHPTAVLGAAFHALCLHRTLTKEGPVSPTEWAEIAEGLEELPSMIRADADLALLWIPSWELASAKPLEASYSAVLAELRNDISRLQREEDYLTRQPDDGYPRTAEALGGSSPLTRGSATKTALLAAHASYVWSKEPLKALRTIANTLGTDTDTIGSMAGALLGCLCDAEPPESVMDERYLLSEADRLYDISQKRRRETFAYPDLLYWRPPKTRSEIVGKFHGEWVVAGLGSAKALDEASPMRKLQGEVWQWFGLSFGQHVLIKRREPSRPLPQESLPLKPRSAEQKGTAMGDQTSLGLAVANTTATATIDKDAKVGIDEATDLAIRSGFDPNVVGTLLMKIAEGDNGVERSIAYAAIIAKAKQARLRKGDTSPGR